jgi:hypothetical protein
MTAMADYDRWDEERDEARRARRRELRDEGPDYRERGFGSAPQIGPTGMLSQSWTGESGTSGRYYEDVGERADYGGFAGGQAGYGSRRIREGRSYREPGAYDEPRAYAAPDRGYDPPIGYGPSDRPHRGYDRASLFEAAARRSGSPYSDYGRAFGGYGAGGGYTPHPDEGIGRRREWAAEGRHRGRGPKGYIRSDERIREDVSDRLTDDPIVDASDIEVLVVGAEVTLNGNVDSRTAKRRAEDCADDVTGVRHVQNNLRVRDAPKPGTLGAETDPRVAAVSEGKDPDRAAHDLAH